MRAASPRYHDAGRDFHSLRYRATRRVPNYFAVDDMIRATHMMTLTMNARWQDAADGRRF